MPCLDGLTNTCQDGALRPSISAAAASLAMVSVWSCKGLWFVLGNHKAFEQTKKDKQSCLTWNAHLLLGALQALPYINQPE